jgi:hypothetical protein
MGMPLDTRSDVTASVTLQRLVFVALLADKVVALSGNTAQVTDSASVANAARVRDMNFGVAAALRLLRADYHTM